MNKNSIGTGSGASAHGGPDENGKTYDPGNLWAAKEPGICSGLASMKLMQNVVQIGDRPRGSVGAGRIMTGL